MNADLDLLKGLHQPGDKIIMLVLDGLGGLPMEPGGPTELEAANTPNLDRLAGEAATGMSLPIRPGIEPGSGPAHLSLFGYDPLQYEVGRGVLEALGIGFPLEPCDIAARGNFATLDAEGRVADRRAGRITTDECVRLADKLQRATTAALAGSGVEVFVRPVKEHRFVVVLRGEGLGGRLRGTDPLRVGLHPLPVRDESGSLDGQRTADLANRWFHAAAEALADEPTANGLNLRGISMDVGLPKLDELYGLTAAAVAVYPMYRGVARLVGMSLVQFEGDRPADEVRALAEAWPKYDFFFVHVKKTDTYGEDGDFAAKAREIEAVDAEIPHILDLEPGVLVVTGDHSTPAKLRQHSWHPVPTLLWGSRVRPDDVERFGERACARGSLGQLHATTLLPQALAHAGRLQRFGA